MSEVGRLTPEQERMRLEGLRILARSIVRRYLASSGVDAGGSPGSPGTPQAGDGQTDGGNPGRKDGAA